MKLLSFALAASAAFAQTPPSRLVTLHVAATDTQGRRVTDLTASEIQITDQGKASPILAFRNEAVRPQAPAGASREFTNKPALAVAHPQVILFDMLNLDISSRQPAIDKIVSTVQNLEAPDAVYLYLLNLTGDLVPVRALPDAPPANTATAWSREVRPMLERAVGPVAAVEAPIRRDLARRVQSAYAALEILAGRLAPLPGRKNILWLTAGVPCVLQTEGGMPWDCRPNLTKVAVKLEQANVSVSPVVLHNLSDPEITSTFQQFIDLTGGKLYPGGEIERAIPDAMELARSCYRIQYAPPANSWDGKLHKIRITSTRKGVTLQSVQSYTAEKSPATVNEKDRHMALFSSAFDNTDIPVSVITSPAAQPKTLHLRITLDPDDLLLLPKDNGFALQLGLYVAAYLPDNRVQPYDPTPVNATLTAEQREKMTREGIHLGNDVLIPEGVRKIRLLVVDRATNRTGTVTIAVN